MNVVDNFYLESIGDILLHKNLLSEEQIAIILRSQKNSQLLFGQLAVKLGFLKENHLIEILSEIYRIQQISLEFTYIDENLLNSLEDYSFFESCMAIPFFMDNLSVKIAVADPGNLRSIDKISKQFPNLKKEFFIAKEGEIKRYIEIIKCRIEKNINDDPQFILNRIIFSAIESKASDIHFEPSENFITVRFRVDGVLQICDSIDWQAWKIIKSKLKIISKLDISENRLPQSGHAKIHLAGKAIDLRISTHPEQHGEKIAIRIFDLSYGVKSLIELGFHKEDLMFLQKITMLKHGLFLIIGPTGSGKTTTLYSILKEIKSPSINIMTLEDPIEYKMEGITQLELRDGGVLSFADGVKSILRQDPDVLLIGEIRDAETAATAIRASLTGRLVFATLHASTPIEALRRLIDLGINLIDLIPTLVGILSQRLVRFEDSINRKGRFPITEYVYFTEKFRENILNGGINQCVSDKTFNISSAEAIKNGLTNKLEIMRVFGDADL